MSQTTTLYKLPQGLGYQPHNGQANPLQSQRHISPQVTTVRAITPQQARAHLAMATRPISGEATSTICKKYPIVCGPGLATGSRVGVF